MEREDRDGEERCNNFPIYRNKYETSIMSNCAIVLQKINVPFNDGREREREAIVNVAIHLWVCILQATRVSKRRTEGESSNL